jgi:multidrug efflux pump subunit AcrA (membrane-fusion protein)
MRKFSRLISLLVLATLLAGCQGYVVQRGQVVKKVEFTGRVSPVEETSLYFKAGGYIKRVLVERDDLVQAGDLLAELEIDDLLKQMAQSQVALNSSQLRLNEAEKSLERQVAQAEWALQIAQIHLKEAEKANERQTAEAQRSLEEAQIRLAQLQQETDPIEIELLRLN